MTSHSGKVFLNSCLKVPIDPCNNCPAPIYNRPKMYLGRLTTTPSINTTIKVTTATTKTSMKCSEIDSETTMWSQQGVRCLAKFYDSIPDYCELNHLPEEEFYSTLDTLRSTCRRLKTKSSLKSYGNVGDATATPASSVSSQSTKTPKSKSKKKITKKKEKQPSHCVADVGRCSLGPSENALFRKQCEKLERINSFKDDFRDEVEAFKKSLKELEDELRQRPRSSGLHKSKSFGPSIRRREDFREINPFEDKSTKSINQQVPEKSKSDTDLRESLRKSFSLNDIQSLDMPSVLLNADVTGALDHEVRSKTIECDSTEMSKMSNYFRPKTKRLSEMKPEIVVEAASPQTCSSKMSSSSVSTTARVTGGGKKKTKNIKCQDQMKVPFSIFNLSNATKENEELSRPSPSPVHPVARPNLAATLRVEVSKKKLKELQNNCTFDDRTPQIDWGVRKTPAWKSLNFNESHKQILSLRLATRKAEQALQKREYELHMELMRQRVKSAPLLLEGTTYWGPSVGKLTHTCPTEGQTHSCYSTQRKQRKKGTRSRPTSEYGCMGGGTSTGGGDGFCSSRLSHKTNTLRKVYASSGKSQSRCTGRGHGKGRQQESMERKCTHTPHTPEQHLPNSSGDDDDLSSVDRAFL